ncbi:MAG: STAS domain-containing protein [Synergistaceae bacterium]|nr:STAS domain-containing protein [Synergistaceae bacterium]
MKLEITRENTVADISFSGGMYFDDVAPAREQLLELVDDGATILRMDFSNLDYIDSSGLGVLLAIHKRCLQRGGKMTITGLKGMVDELFKLTRLDLVFMVRQ